VSDPRFEVQLDGGRYPEIRWPANGVWFCCNSIRIYMGSNLTADPNNRPSRLVIEMSDTAAQALADYLAIPTLQAPPRDEFLKRLEAIEGNLRRLVER
jgi:hypothetical protein